MFSPSLVRSINSIFLANFRRRTIFDRRSTMTATTIRCDFSTTSIRAGKFQRSSKKFPMPQPLKQHSKKSSRPTTRVWADMTIRDLARAMDVDPDYVFHLLLQTEYADVFGQYDDRIAHRDLITRLATMAGFRAEFVAPLNVESALGLDNDVDDMDEDAYRRPPADPLQCESRSPVVTIMGHVDHGKTTLLDQLRHSQIAANEFGGITQHIGAFVVKLPHTGAKITFLDTPGHAAFKSMRARGARVTDIVVLVVAADDGVMEQTVESIRFAKESGVTMVVAINKCDKFNADVKKSKADLLAHDIHLEEYGGDVQAICISALEGTNLVQLQEAIVAQAELMNLRADYKGLVEGAVIETKTAHGKGGVSTILVQRGTLKKGCFLVAGEGYCRVRALYDEFGKAINEAPPSTPVEVTGWKDDLPSAGDEILEVESERRAKEVVAWRKMKAMDRKAESERPIIEQKRAEARDKYEIDRKAKQVLGYLKNNPSLPQSVDASGTSEQIPRLNVILKGDVDGSVEAILEVYETYKSSNCRFDMVTFGIGPVTDGDLELAAMTKAKIYCFNIKNPQAIENEASEKGLDIRHFNVIYKLVDDWKNELSNLLPMKDQYDVRGEAVVLKEFLIGDKAKPKLKTVVAGCRVTKGVMNRKQRCRVVRDEQIIHDGTVESMKKEKLVTNTASHDEEVGIVIEDQTVRFYPNDVVQSYETFKIPQRIDWSPPGF